MFTRTTRQRIYTLLILCLTLSNFVGLVPPPVAQATENTNAHWKIEKWSEEKWTEAGGTITYHLTVTRRGPPASGVRIIDGRDSSHTSGYGSVSPPPDEGGGTSTTIRWNVGDMNTGQRFEAVYQVTVNLGVSLGTTIDSYMEVIADPPAVDYSEDIAVASAVDQFEDEPPDYFSNDYWVPVADEPPNKTTGANAGAQTAPPEPINAGTGEYYTDPIVDFDLGGPLPLTFSRYYATGLHDEEVITSTLGSNWLHNFDMRLLAPDTWRRVVFHERGKLIHFQFVGGALPGVTWERNFRQEPVPYILREDNVGHYWLMDPIQELVYRFDAAGLLQEIRDRNANRFVLGHDGNGRITLVSDGLGRALNFTYTGDRLTQVAHGTRHVDFTYDGNSHLTTATDAEDNQTTYTYAANVTHGPLMTAQTRPEDNTPYTQTYNATGQAIRQEDAYSNVSTIEHDTPAAGLTRVTDPAGVQILTHADRRLGTAVQDRAGNSYTLDFDDREHMTALHDRLEDTARVSYHDLSGKIAAYTDALGHTTTYTYTAQVQAFADLANPSQVVNFTFYNLTQVHYPDGTDEHFTHDESGNVLSHTDRLDKVWTFTYNALGQPQSVTNPEAGVTTYTYDADGTLASSTDSDLGVTTYGYDTFMRLNRITHPASATSAAGGSTSQAGHRAQPGTAPAAVQGYNDNAVHFSYDLNDRLLSVTDELDRVTQFSYDGNGNVITSTNALSETIGHGYDLMDRVDAISDAAGQVEELAYDELGRLASITDRNDHTWTYAYDARGWLIGVTDPLSNTWTTTYDDEGVPTATSTPQGYTTAYQSDKLGYTTAITDPLGAATTFTYDELGRLTATTDREDRTTDYGYDDAGRLLSVAQPVIGTATYTRNDLGRLTDIADLRGKVWTFAYSPMGRRTAHTDPLTNGWAYDYDAQGRLVQVTYQDTSTTSYTYDDASQVTQIAYPGGPTLNYTYDDAGRLLTADQISLTYDERGDVINSQDGSAAFGATYDDGQRLKTVTYDGQATVTYTYDERDLLIRVEDNLANAWLTFAYDDDSRLTGVTRSNGVGTTFTYDDAGRVTRIQDGPSAGSGLANQQYTLNAEGEPTQVVRTLPLDLPPVGQVGNLSYDDASQINSPGYAYDTRGRQTAAPNTALTYDGANRLTSITADGQTADLSYNGLDDLRTRTVLALSGVEGAGTTTTYYHNYALRLAPIVAEMEETGFLGETRFLKSGYKDFYVYTPGGSLLYSIDPTTNEVRFYHFDRVGSTLFLTDGTGSVTDAYAYDPYGVLLGHDGASDQPFTYVGRYGVRRESVGGLYDMRARTYDPATARFLTRDPVWPALADPQSLNPYQYAYQNPLMYMDPQGAKGWSTETAAEMAAFMAEYAAEKAGDPQGTLEWTAERYADLEARILWPGIERGTTRYDPETGEYEYMRWLFSGRDTIPWIPGRGTVPERIRPLVNEILRRREEERRRQEEERRRQDYEELLRDYREEKEEIEANRRRAARIRRLQIKFLKWMVKHDPIAAREIKKPGWEGAFEYPEPFLEMVRLLHEKERQRLRR